MSRVADSPVAPRIGAAGVAGPTGIAGPRAVRRIAPAGGRADTVHRAGPPPRHRSAPDAADDARRRLPVAVVLAVPVVVLGAVPALRFADWAWASLCLAAPAVVWAGAPFHRAAGRALRRGTATTDTLVSMAVLAALAWSVVVLAPGDATPTPLDERPWSLPGRSSGPEVHLYLAVAVLLTVVALAGRAAAPEGPDTRGVGTYSLLVAMLAAGVGGFWLATAGTARATAAAAGVLVVAWPPALAVAGPVAHRAATRRGAHLGVGLRTAAGLDRATQVDTIVLAPADLTGAGHHPGPPGSAEGRADLVVEPSAAGAAAALRDLGLRTVLLTAGDPQGSLALAGRVGIAEVFAEIVPRDRVTVVRRLQNEGRTVAFVGDPTDVHDRSALAQADLGLGRAAVTVRVEVDDDPATVPAAPTRGDGDVGLAGGALWNAADAVRLAGAARRTAGRNRALAFAGSAAALPLAAVGSLTPLAVLAAPALAGLAILVSSLRLRSLRSARPPAHHRA